jgi:hypothetical protein
MWDIVHSLQVRPQAKPRKNRQETHGKAMRIRVRMATNQGLEGEVRMNGRCFESIQQTSNGAAALVAIQSRNISAELIRGRTSTLTSKNRAHPCVQKRWVKLYRREGQVSMQSPCSKGRHGLKLRIMPSLCRVRNIFYQPALICLPHTGRFAWHGRINPKPWLAQHVAKRKQRRACRLPGPSCRRGLAGVVYGAVAACMPSR